MCLPSALTRSTSSSSLMSLPMWLGGHQLRPETARTRFGCLAHILYSTYGMYAAPLTPLAPPQGIHGTPGIHGAFEYMYLFSKAGCDQSQMTEPLVPSMA